MKKLSIIQMMVTAGMLMFTSCFGDLPFTQTPTDGTPPPPVTNVQAQSLPGGAIIKYKLPTTDTDISYVKAEYMYNGKTKVVRESIYRDSLIIEGIASMEPISVNIYVVDHSENLSTPETVSFTPDTPPIETIFNSLQLTADFGGVLISWTNETLTEIGITIFIEDTLGVMREQDTHFSKEEDGLIAFRGFDTVETRFAISITDKWGNISDRKEEVVIPLYETLLDKTKFAGVILPGDNYTMTSYAYQPFSAWFDGNTSTNWHSDYTDLSWSFPMYVSIDFGVEARLSRFRLWPQVGFLYGNFTFRKFEVWGAKEIKTGVPDSYWTDGDWKNDWVKFNDYEVKRPSGNTESINNPTGEDLAAAQAGWEFIVPLETPNCRYVRFVINTIWTSGTGLCMTEVSFWGDNR
jgi:hypothetical protein